MSGAEKVVKQIIETLSEHKGIGIVKKHVVSLAEFVYDDAHEKEREKPLQVEEKQQSHKGIIINSKIFGWIQK